MRLMYLFTLMVLSSCIVSPVMSTSQITFQKNIQGVPTKITMRRGVPNSPMKDIPTLFEHLTSFFKNKPKASGQGKANGYRQSKVYKIFGKTYHILDKASGYKARGIASWYGAKFHRRKTSSGDRYNMYAMTAAHKTLPLPTYVRVRNLSNGREVIVKVNDRGPFYKDRIIDLSYAAGAKLGLLVKGTALVEVEALPKSILRG